VVEIKQVQQNHILVGGCGLAAGITCVVCAVLSIGSFTDGNGDEGTMYAEIAVFTGGLSILLFHFARIAFHSRNSNGQNSDQ